MAQKRGKTLTIRLLLNNYSNQKKKHQKSNQRSAANQRKCNCTLESLNWVASDYSCLFVLWISLDMLISFINKKPMKFDTQRYDKMQLSVLIKQFYFYVKMRDYDQIITRVVHLSIPFVSSLCVLCIKLFRF